VENTTAILRATELTFICLNHGLLLAQSDASAALVELNEVSNELAALPVSKVIWDIEDRGKAPPWGDNIADTITDLSNYFVTSTGRDLIASLCELLEELRDNGGVARYSGISRGRRDPRAIADCRGGHA
jgi:hypothetical protein